MKTNNAAGDKIRIFIALHFLMFAFSLSSLFLKKASGFVLISWEFVLYMGLAFMMLGIYALFFQQILKKMKLTTAYANKAIVIVWGILWDRLFIGDTNFTWGKIAGFILILAGIYFMVSDDE